MNKKGLTLIELLVGVGIFGLAFSLATGLFVGALKIQRRILALQEILNQSSYNLEYMSRALRMVKKDLTGKCLDSAGLNYQITQNGLGIRFLNYKDQCQEFYLDQTTLRLKEKNETEDYLTPDDLEVLNFNLNLVGESQKDNLQPQVTLFLKIQSPSLQPRPEIKIQTTLSQRNLDVLQ